MQRPITRGCARNLCLLVLLLAFAVLPSINVRSQSFRNLYNFPGPYDGGFLLSGVMLISNTLYGTSYNGSLNWNGTVYAVNTDGSGFHVVCTFGDYEGNPTGTFAIADNTLYTAGALGAANGGSLLQVPIDVTNDIASGWYDFASALGDGTGPDGVIFSSGILYGVTHYGGKGGHGTVYAYDGAVATYLHSFSGSDGAYPNNSLVLYNGTLYGVTGSGGTWGSGTVYCINVDGLGFKTLHHFGGSTNGEGADPVGSLILWGDTLFGTTISGGVSSTGTVFSVTTNGTDFKTLYHFSGGLDGAQPAAGLNLAGNTLYGTTKYGGAAGWGTIFALTIDGSRFITLHSFSGGWGEAIPVAKMLLINDTLYGTTSGYRNGLFGPGAVFSFSLAPSPPQLIIKRSGQNVVLTWPTDGNFVLQSAANLGFGSMWSKVSSTPIVLSGLNTLTEAVSDAQQFYRLGQ